MEMNEHVINEEVITCDEGAPGEPAKVYEQEKSGKWGWSAYRTVKTRFDFISLQ
jgi:hypothetical protein